MRRIALWRKAIRFVIARSEATWQSRSTKLDNRKAIGENAENSRSDQSEACGEEKSGRVIITLFKQKRVNYP